MSFEIVVRPFAGKPGSVALTEERPAIIRFFHLHPDATPGRTFRVRIAQQSAPGHTALDPVLDSAPFVIA